ncbi:hypothetical protein ApAK_05455 [Thermoplasmatales archaeon AK]|nr:hypothetical protein [Thermoplasmatales archaeon AK]
MAIPKRAIVLGDGTAGITLANKLRYLTSEKDLEVFLVGNSQRQALNLWIFLLIMV